MKTVLAVCAMLLLASLAVAQAPLSPTTTHLYIRSNGAPYLTVDATPGSESIEAASGDNPTVDGQRGWSIPLEGGLAESVLLDGAGMITFTAAIGGGTGAGSFDATFVLTSAEAEVARASVSEVTYAGSYQPISVEAPVLLERLDAADPLTLTITASGSAVQLFLDVDDENGIELPITAVDRPQGIIMADLAPGPVDLSWQLDNATDAAYAYNWTGPAGEMAVNLSGNLTGNVSLHFLYDNQTVLAANLTGQINETRMISLGVGMGGAPPSEVQGNASGNATGNQTNQPTWVLHVVFQNATGVFQLGIDQVYTMAPPMEGPAPEEPTPEAPDNGAPGLSLLALIGLLGMMVRRRTA